MKAFYSEYPPVYYPEAQETFRILNESRSIFADECKIDRKMAQRLRIDIISLMLHQPFIQFMGRVRNYNIK